ncbi:adhesion G protein-coupled receptor L3-like [Montipora capricornis]|uniref:adhesion G protein-coupled receptor L3-like n=1 Tax=Montipora capricornis TaxID=246305 RepID=UPI0035F18AC8
MKTLLCVVLFLCGLKPTTRAYYINENKVNWAQATELCRKNGSILAVVDSQQKIDKLSNMLSSLGHQSGNVKFWIGLKINQSIEEFVWSTGEIVEGSFLNSTCGINPNLNRRLYWCFLFKNVNANSSCFEARLCRNAFLRFGFICQSLSSAEVPSNLSSTISPITSPTESASKKSTVTLNSNIAVEPTSSPLAEESTTAALQFAAPTSRNTATNALHAQPTLTVSTLSQSIRPPDNRKSITTYVISHNTAWTTTLQPATSISTNIATNVLHSQATVTASTHSESIRTYDNRKSITSSVVSREKVESPFNAKLITSTSSFLSTIADFEVNDRTETDNPVSEFINFVASLNPREPQSLELLTDEYRHFAISMKTSGNKDIEKNVIESVQAIEDFAFKYASFNLNSSKTQERKENQHIVIQLSLVPKGYTQNFTFTNDYEEDEAARITLPSHIFRNQDTVVFNALYPDLHKYVANSIARESRFDSIILGTSINPSQNAIFEENVTIVLQTLTKNHEKSHKSCAFWMWNYSYKENGSWSSEGCWLVESRERNAVCKCNHLTNFAILMNIKEHELPHKHKLPLAIITYIGLGFSLLGETITILAYILLLWSKQDQQSHVHINLVATLATAQVIFLAGIESTKDQVLCITVAALIHYFYLSSFCWMLIEGVMLYLLIIEVYNTELRLRYCYLFSFGFPGLVVTGTLLTAHLTDDGIYQYRARKWCWLSAERHYIWAFAAPVILITFVNMIIFCAVVKEMISMPSATSTKLNALKTTIKACVILFPLLGVTWLFGLLSLAEGGAVTQYAFTLFNSIQGLLIFLLHCVRNSEVRSVWDKKLKYLKKQTWGFFGIGSSPPCTSEPQSYKQERSEMELGRRNNRITPVEG